MILNMRSTARAARLGRPLKDVDSAGQCLVLNTFFKIFPLLAVLGLVAGGIAGLLAAAGFSVLVAFLCVGAGDALGSFSVNLLYGMGRCGWSLREQLEGDLNRVRVHKMNGRFDQALTICEDILARDPLHPEALMLKARILKDGFQDLPGAKQCLLPLLRAEKDKNSEAYRWAAALYREWTRPET